MFDSSLIIKGLESTIKYLTKDVVKEIEEQLAARIFIAYNGILETFFEDVLKKEAIEYEKFENEMFDKLGSGAISNAEFLKKINEKIETETIWGKFVRPYVLPASTFTASGIIYLTEVGIRYSVTAIEDLLYYKTTIAPTSPTKARAKHKGKTIPGAHVNPKGAERRVLRRTSKSRYPVKDVYGPSLAEHYIKNERYVLNKAFKKLPKDLNIKSNRKKDEQKF